MPSKMRPDDWDRLFSSRVPKRGGPLRALANVLITIGLCSVIAVGSVYVLQLRTERTKLLVAQATVGAQTIGPLATATAVAETATANARVAASTATAAARQQPTPEPNVGAGIVTNGGNLRSEPRVANDTVVGLIWPGDQVVFLEQRTVGGQSWFRVRLAKPADNRAGTGVNAGTAGWVSATLLSPQP